MAAPPLPLQVDLSRRPLLLGDAGDVPLLDCRVADPVTVARRVAAAVGDRPVGIRLSDAALAGAAVTAGAALVHLDPDGASAPEVRAASRAGAVVVLGGHAEAARVAGIHLLGRGARAGRVVIEMVVSDDERVDVDLVRTAEAAGLAVGAVLRAGEGTVDEVAGWEIGVLTHLLQVGVRTVRNVSSIRFHRVSAVVGALAEARTAGLSTDAARPGRTQQASGRTR